MKRVMFAILLMLMTAMHASAADNPSAKISFKLKDTDVGKAFSILTQQGGIPVIGDPSVTGKVNCSLNNVTVDEALDVICKINKLSWLKVYAVPEENGSFVPSKLFKVYDALVELGGGSLICENPETSTQTAFVPALKAGTISTDVARSLNLKPVYIVRIMPEITAAKEAKAKQEQEAMLEKQRQESMAYGIPPGDPQMAADRIWDYFNQMTSDQRRQFVDTIRQKLFGMSSDQKHQLENSILNRRNQQQQ